MKLYYNTQNISIRGALDEYESINISPKYLAMNMAELIKAHSIAATEHPHMVTHDVPRIKASTYYMIYGMYILAIEEIPNGVFCLVESEEDLFEWLI